MKKVIIKDTVMKTITSIIWFGLFVYVWWLFMQGQQVTVSSDTNIIALILCIVVAVFLLILVFRPRLVTTNRWVLWIIGILVILSASYWLADNADQMIYLRDIMILVWVYITITGPTKLLIPQKVQEALADEKVEIIEV